MASTTGIELGREACVLAGVRPSRTGTADIVALHTIESGAWPTLDVALVETLRGVRRGKRFPRNARIVAWGLPDDPAGDEATARWLQRPILAAGFRVESIVTPPQALALLAASRPRSGNGAVAWLALNIQAAAIAIVHDGELLFARTFEWSYSALTTSGKAQLLQRYSLVAQLAPEVRRGIAAVLANRGLTVEQAVTCGDLPELRSLTMPLIEELDLEVETLDSTEGLRAVGKAKAERFAESAPAIRLACAVALAPSSKRRGSATRSVARIAAAVGVVSALGWGSYALWRAASISTAGIAPSTPRPSAARPAAAPPGPAARGPAKATGSPQGRAQGPAVTKPAVVPAPSLAAATPGPRVVAPRVAGDPKVTQPAARSGAPGSLAQAAPPKPTGTSIVTAPPRVEPKPAAAPPVSAGLKTSAPIVTAPPKVEPKPAAAPPVSAGLETPPPIVTAPPRVEPKPVAASPATAKLETRPIVTPPAKVVAPPVKPAMRAVPPVAAASAGPAARPFPGAPRTFEPPAPDAALRTAEPRAPAPRQPLPPLKDALPKVDSILIDQDRRLAIVDGTIVSIGDTVGPRVVVQIDPAGVVLREPSGLSVRIALRAKTTL